MSCSLGDCLSSIVFPWGDDDFNYCFKLTSVIIGSLVTGLSAVNFFLTIKRASPRAVSSYDVARVLLLVFSAGFPLILESFYSSSIRHLIFGVSVQAIVIAACLVTSTRNHELHNTLIFVSSLAFFLQYAILATGGFHHALATDITIPADFTVACWGSVFSFVFLAFYVGFNPISEEQITLLRKGISLTTVAPSRAARDVDLNANLLGGDSSAETNEAYVPLGLDVTEEGARNSFSTMANPYDFAGFFSKLCFSWCNEFIIYGSENVIKIKDLLPLPDRYSPKSVSERFNEQWTHQVKTIPAGARSLWKALVYANLFEFVTSAIVKAVYDISLYVGPYLLKEIIAFLTTTDDLVANSGHGLTLGLALLFIQIISTFLLHQYFNLSFTLGINFKTTLVQAILEKSLRLPNGGASSSGPSTTPAAPAAGGRGGRPGAAAATVGSGTGALISLTSVDVNRVQDVMGLFHTIWSGFLQLFIGCGILFSLLGWSFLAGMTIMIISIPIAMKISKRGQAINKLVMKQKDKRIKLTTEVLTGIKILKLYAWEVPFTNKIEEERRLELAEALRYKLNIALNRSIFACIPVLVGVFSFVSYIVVSGETLEVGQALTALLIFSQLRFPLNMMPNMIVSIIEAGVSLSRIQSLLERPEPPKRPQLTASAPESYWKATNGAAALATREPLIKVNDADFDWPSADNMPVVQSSEEEALPAFTDIIERDKVALERYTAQISPAGKGPALLRDVSFQCRRGELTVIVGATGCGKSGLVQSIVGETMRTKGSLEVRGSIAYASQVPWIQNQTLRDNILFGLPYVASKYDRVVEACSLVSDFTVLQAGDQTEIGEKGINLSGGQKARVALARAVYASPDVIILDDILAAVDSHVGAHIFKNCIQDLLINELDCAVVLVTHATYLLNHADQILVVKNQKIAYRGDFETLGRVNPALKDEVMHSGEDKKEKKTKDESSSPVDETSAGDDKKKSDKAAPTANTPPTSTSVAKIATKDETKTVAAKAPTSMGRLVEEEKNQEGRVSTDVYTRYVKEIGGWPVALFVVFSAVFMQGSTVLSSTTLTGWTKGNPTKADQINGLISYGIIGLSTVFFTALLFFSAAKAAQRGSRNFHYQLLSSVLNAPMRFFDTTPVGRLINRFSKDMNSIDDAIVMTLMQFVNQVLTVGSTIAIVVWVIPISIIPIVLFSFVFRYAQKLYVPTSRQLRRLESSLRSPYIALLTEVIAGSSVIRAFAPSAPVRFTQANSERIEWSQRAYNLSIGVNRWIAFRLEIIGNIITALAAIVCLVPQLTFHDNTFSADGTHRGHWVEPANVGLVLTYTMSINQALSWLVRMVADVESNIVAVERVLEYCNCPQEIQQATDAYSRYEDEDEITVATPDAEWPVNGAIEFSGVSLRYAPQLPRVIKKLDFSVNPGERIGLVGRTGAGKSSLLLALLRLVELDDNKLSDEVEFVDFIGADTDGNDKKVRIKSKDGSNTTLTRPALTPPGFFNSGSIKIDGKDIAKDVTLANLRSKISVIPQDPVLFTGTLKFNLDPFGAHSDEKLRWALEKSHMIERISSDPKGLEMNVEEGGSNFSVGERQLLCIARALLRKSKILLLDEATSSIDLQTDALIQQTIREAFSSTTANGEQNCTLLTIAHRINTIIDYDRILVLDNGNVKEFDSPEALLSKKDGVFRSLAAQAGIPVPELFE